MGKRLTKGPKNTIFGIERNNKSLLIESNPFISQRTYSSRLIASTELRIEIEIEEKGGEKKSGGVFKARRVGPDCGR